MSGMDTVRSHGSSRYAVEYDAFGQVIVSEGGNGSLRYSVRSRGSAGTDSKSGHAAPSDNALQSSAPNGTSGRRQLNGATNAGLSRNTGYRPISTGKVGIHSFIHLYS